MNSGEGSRPMYPHVPNLAISGEAGTGGGLTKDERAKVEEAGLGFEQEVKNVCLLISGRFESGNGRRSTEKQVKDLMMAVFGYPDPDRPELTINVLLDSPGGNLDSAYTTMLYLYAYAEQLNVYVPGRAKSASTLLAVGADHVYLSAFGELGPLDTQIPDPRNPTNDISALDCYQSVDYVTDFGFKTITTVLPQLIGSTERRIAVNELLDTASTFALGAIRPILQSVTTLDFGGWGRSLRIGEHYARKLLEARGKKDDSEARVDDIAHELVFGYTHHLFPIDHREAAHLGLGVSLMSGTTYEKAIKVVEACNRRSFVGFLSQEHAEKAAKAAESAGVGGSTSEEERTEHKADVTSDQGVYTGQQTDR